MPLELMRYDDHDTLKELKFWPSYLYVAAEIQTLQVFTSLSKTFMTMDSNNQ